MYPQHGVTSRNVQKRSEKRSKRTFGNEAKREANERPGTKPKEKRGAARLAATVIHIAFKSMSANIFRFGHI